MPNTELKSRALALPFSYNPQCMHWVDSNLLTSADNHIALGMQEATPFPQPLS
jgi:hypothetical protein